MVVVISKPARPVYYICAQALYGGPSETRPAHGETSGVWRNPARLFSRPDLHLEHRSALPALLRSSNKPLSLPCALTATANTNAGHLSREGTGKLVRAVLRHPNILTLLVPPPYHDGMTINSPAGPTS